ncbi:MAG: hypothetical protein OSB10_00680, partial [Planctomycetota bacterium]|nr:hypothetical protein [Planctomycetota bacterium]
GGALWSKVRQGRNKLQASGLAPASPTGANVQGGGALDSPGSPGSDGSDDSDRFAFASGYKFNESASSLGRRDAETASMAKYKDRLARMNEAQADLKSEIKEMRSQRKMSLAAMATTLGQSGN